MEHALRTRAVSLTAAAGVCGFALMALLSVQVQSMRFAAPDGADSPSIDLVRPDPPTPDVQPKWEPPPRVPLIDQTVEIPSPIAEPSELAQSTVLPVDLFSSSSVSGPETVTDPHWLQQPRNLERYYPVRALRRNIEGQARVACVVNTAGWLVDCVVLSETPIGWGFGAAALRIAGEHRMSPAMQDGRAVEAQYRMVVPFQLH